MSAVELAVEKVKALSESEAQALLAWLNGMKPDEANEAAAPSVESAVGFARRYRARARPTNEWMKELRQGEQ